MSPACTATASGPRWSTRREPAVSRPFKRSGGGLVVTLNEAEAELLGSIPEELSAAMQTPPGSGDPVHERLFPRAYLDPTEESAESNWQDVVHPELVRERLAALQLLVDSLERGTRKRGRVEVHLEPDEAQAWLGVLNDARLALGIRLQVTEDLDLSELDPNDPDTPAYAVYGWLTWLQGELVETLLG
jgi:hypothetical protein